jgi:cyclopropane-fatty-acyl-phospholipid synthase
MTVQSERRSANHWPGLDVVPSGPRARFSAKVARRLFAAAVDRLDVTVHVGDQTLGRGGPAMTVHRPEEFFLRLGRHQLIGFGEA